MISFPLDFAAADGLAFFFGVADFLTFLVLDGEADFLTFFATCLDGDFGLFSSLCLSFSACDNQEHKILL